MEIIIIIIIIITFQSRGLGLGNRHKDQLILLSKLCDRANLFDIENYVIYKITWKSEWCDICKVCDRANLFDRKKYVTDGIM